MSPTQKREDNARHWGGHRLSRLPLLPPSETFGSDQMSGLRQKRPCRTTASPQIAHPLLYRIARTKREMRNGKYLHIPAVMAPWAGLRRTFKTDCGGAVLSRRSPPVACELRSSSRSVDYDRTTGTGSGHSSRHPSDDCGTAIEALSVQR